jgi:hypothetical protein
MQLYQPTITGSLSVSGSINISGSINVVGGGGTITGTASYATNAELLDGLDSTVFTLTSSFAAQTASFTAFTASQNILNGKYATTSSNTFTGIQTVNSNLVVTGSITAQTLVVQTITSSVDFVTGSTRFGSLSANTHTFTGSLLISGSTHSVFGNVVIGNTSSINANAKLEVKGDLFLTPSSSASPIIHLYNRDSSNETYIYDSGSSSASTLIFAPAGSTKMVVSSSGNIGIGTTNPTAKLHIINATDGFTARFTGGAASTVTAGIYANSTTGFASIGVQSAHQFRIFTSDADRLTITSDGNIGINTISPTAKLHIIGITGLPATSGTSQNGTLRLQLSGYGTVLDFGGEGPSTGKQWIQATDASSLAITYPLLLNPNGGNVGIGTTSPGARLDISTTSSNSIFSAATSYTWTSGYLDHSAFLAPNMTGGSVSIAVGKTYGTYNVGKIVFNYAGSSSTSNSLGFGFYDGDNKLVVAASGNIGIGITNPGAKLDIEASAPYVLRATNTGAATGNAATTQFINTNGDHSWGICAEFRVGNGSGTDRPSILFSNGYDTNTWGLGFGYNDSSYFRINKDQGNYGGGWGTTLFSMDRSGNYSFAGSNVSDRRNKKDITYIEDSQLSTILKLKPASFNKKSPRKDEYSDHVHTGFIAQDVLEENIPNLVHGNEEEGYGLDYDGILALAVKAIQELKAEIEILKNK